MLFPYEIQEYIISFLPFEKTLNYPFISKQKYNPEFHTWKWAGEFLFSIFKVSFKNRSALNKRKLK